VQREEEPTEEDLGIEQEVNDWLEQSILIKNVECEEEKSGADQVKNFFYV
jgi:hypothetical protein